MRESSQCGKASQRRQVPKKKKKRERQTARERERRKPQGSAGEER